MNREFFILRQKEMKDLRNEGKTLQEIANRYGISRERVRQIVSREIFVVKPPKLLHIRKRNRNYPEHRRKNIGWDKPGFKQSYMREQHRENRKMAMEVLGNCCKRCGFSDERALQIDHINGGGVQELRNTPSYARYRWIRDNPEEAKKKYQVLCANCNWIKRHENNEVTNWRKIRVS